MDEEDDLFTSFCCFMVKVVDLVLDTYMENEQCKHNAPLDIWKRCNFSGAEAFHDVKK